MPTPSPRVDPGPEASSWGRGASARLAAIASAALLAACSSSSSNGLPPPLTVTATPSSVVANGTNTIAVHVDGSTKGPISVSANRGTFPNGLAQMSFAATPIDTTLKSCDATVTATCAGATHINAVDANFAAGGVDVTFTAPGGSTSCATCSTSACLGQTCATNSVCQNTAPAGQPVNLQCVNVTSQYAVSVAASATRIPADGAATAVITATVTFNGTPAAGRTVNFSQTGSTATLGAASATTNSSGQATVVLTSAAAGGTATVTATDASTSQFATVAVAMPQLGQVNLLSPTSGVLGVRYSGFQETMVLTFQLLDVASAAYPPGLAVSFSHQSLGTSYIGPSASCSAGIPSVCTAAGVTNSQGQVSVLLTSGKAAGVVTVAASATAGGLSAQGTASNFAVVGAKASGAHITVDCSPKNVPALTNNDCNYSHYAGPGSTITCTATFADRFNNILGVSTLATFASEAGSAGPPASTAMYDPKQPPTAQTGLGQATDFIAVSGGKLPIDVPAVAGEYSLTYTDPCGTLQHNPRDGLSTIIVMANGEEGFVDVNANGVYDGPGSAALVGTPYATTGEPFIDMGEPFIDMNDNGKWDSGEPFWDLNGNLAYDGPNGVWDAKTVIWAETRVVYTGFPMVLGVTTPTPLEEGSRFYDSAAPPAPTAPVSWGPATSPLYGSPGPATSYNLGLVAMDGNFNAVVPNATYAIAPLGTNVVTAKLTRLPTTVDNLGMTFTQQYCGSSTVPSAANGWTVTPIGCGNVCASAPCYVVTNVGTCSAGVCSGFSYGSWATAQVTGACSAASSDTVDATCTINSVVTHVSVGGTCCPGPAPQINCGTYCANALTDANNCGKCGNVCPAATPTCVSGACK